MSSSFAIRFPDGMREFAYPSRPLQVGDILWHDGERYRVVSVEDEVVGHIAAVTVESVRDEDDDDGLELVPLA